MCLPCESAHAQGGRWDLRGALHRGNHHRDLVGEAPGPVLARLERANQRVLDALGVCRGVAVRRVVATADMAALEADAEVKPLAANGQAVLAALDGFR